jgi:hypothetical protein
VKGEGSSEDVKEADAKHVRSRGRFCIAKYIFFMLAIRREAVKRQRCTARNLSVAVAEKSSMAKIHHDELLRERKAWPTGVSAAWRKKGNALERGQ